LKILGIIGGIAPGSTVEYYRLLVEGWRRKTAGYPPILINSIDLDRMLRLVAAKAFDELVAYLGEELERLARAGAQFALLASNTPHIVFDRLRAGSRIPLLSIVEATGDAAAALGLKRAGLLGTRSTMQAAFYPEALSRRGIALVTPTDDEQAYIHGKYMGELVNGVFSSDTRDRILRIADRMKKEDGMDGLILGGTELPLLLRADSHDGTPLLDTTRIHVDAALTGMLAA
jgi:aspartate racemase